MECLLYYIYNSWISQVSSKIGTFGQENLQLMALSSHVQISFFWHYLYKYVYVRKSFVPKVLVVETSGFIEI